jgi:mannose-6-phosphate isomerase-like protein (cupin superfamily)
MERFQTRQLPSVVDAMAPDGSEVRILCSGARGSMAHFSLPGGQVSQAVAHHGIEEIWYFLAGRGRFWRKRRENEEIIKVSEGVSITIPPGTHFQFRNDGNEALTAVGVSMPPWPGEDEAYPVAGVWQPVPATPR